jgi:DNA repair protein SbcD/Mre11
MIRILHTADVHLDAPFHFLGEKGAKHRRQIRETFTRITRLAAEERYDLLLIAGDLFNDNHPARDTQHFVITTLGTLPCQVCILPGNHDYLDRRSIYHKLTLPPNVHLLSEHPTYLTFADLDLTVAGNPIPSRHDNAPQLRGIVRDGASRWFVALAHGNMQVPGPFETTSRPIEPDSIAATGADYVALGDWHTFANYSQSGVNAFYSGAPEPTSISQTKTGTVASVTLADHGVAVEPIRVGTIEARAVEINVTGHSETEVVAAIQAQAGADLMLNVTLAGLKSADNLLDLEAIYEAAACNFYWLQVADKALLSLDAIDPNEFPEAFVIGQYVRLLAEYMEQAADERERRVAESALQLGVALLKGHKVL